MSKEQYIRDSIDSLFRTWLLWMLPIGALIFLLFSFLDFFAFHEEFARILPIRSATALVLCSVFIAARKTRNRITLRSLAFVGAFAAAACVEVIILLTGGYTSPHVLGMILLVVSILAFPPAEWNFHAVMAVMLYGIVVIPLFVYHKALDHPIGGLQALSVLNFFVSSIILTVFVFRYLSLQHITKQFSAEHELLISANELQQREEQLIEAKKQWELTFASVPDMIAILDNDHRILRVNKAMADLLGRTMKECIGLQCYEVIHMTDTPPDFCPHTCTIRDCQIHSREVHEEHLGMDMLVTTTPLFDDNGILIGSVHVSRDITEHKEAERQIKAQKDFSMNIINRSPAVICGITPDGITTFLNPAGEAATGYRSEELIGKDWWRTFFPGDEYRQVELLFHELRKGSVRDYEMTLTARNGYKRIISWNFLSEFDINGNIINHIVFGIDVTERKQNEQALIELNRSLEEKVFARTRFYSMRAMISKAINHASDRQELFRDVCSIMMTEGGFALTWIGLVDADRGKVTPIEKSGDADCLDGITVSTDDRNEERKPAGRAISESHYSLLHHIDKYESLPTGHDQAGGYGLRSSSAFPLLSKGQVIGFLNVYSTKSDIFSDDEVALLSSVAEDISFALDTLEINKKRVEAEAMLKELNESLEKRIAQRTENLHEVNNELEAFIYSISHDLRAPLRSIVGFSKALYEHSSANFDETGSNYLSRIIRGGEKMSRLIDDLLRLSRISRQELQIYKVDISRMAAIIAEELGTASPARHVEINIEECPSVMADRRLIEIVLSNLLENAWKFTSKIENARIQFGAIKEENKVVYYVRDNGAGFDTRYAEKMFWPFQRLHSSSDFEGTGIGLAIVERIIRRHGGKIWAEGSVGKGATIYFTLKEDLWKETQRES